MKKIKNLLILMLAFLTVSCIEKEPEYQDFPSKDVDFTFAVSGDEYQRDFYYVSTLQFTNVSSKQGSVTWDFGDGTTSTEENPTHKYAEAGLYKVTLSIDGVGKCTYPILIMDIAPVMSISSQSEDVLVIKEVSVDLSVDLPNPDNLICQFTWILPEGTMDAEGNPLPEKMTFESNPDGTIPTPGSLTFTNVGSQKIEIQTYFDINGENRRLNDSYVNVQVGFTQEVPTLYYANYGGNLKAYKIIPSEILPEGVKNLPFDLGVSTGNTPQCLVFATVTTNDVEEDFVYILDCGKNYVYQNDTNGTMGDGKITVASADGTYSNVVITNVGGHAFSDPFQGFAKDGLLYYTDRNTGISTVELGARGLVEKRINSSNDEYFVTNNTTGYYNDGITFGAVNTGIYIDKNDVFYWPKSYSGKGIYRFTRSDILTKSDSEGGNAPHDILLPGVTPKAFILDETRKHMYVWQTSGVNPAAGFTQYPIVGLNETLDVAKYTKAIKMSALPVYNSVDEGLYVTQFALDETNGNVYFGFTSNDDANYQTGIHYYDYATGTIKSFENNTEKVLGICINPRKTKLF